MHIIQKHYLRALPRGIKSWLPSRIPHSLCYSTTSSSKLLQKSFNPRQLRLQPLIFTLPLTKFRTMASATSFFEFEPVDSMSCKPHPQHPSPVHLNVLATTQRIHGNLDPHLQASHKKKPSH